MRAFAVRSWGEAPAVHDLPVPTAPDAFLIQVRYAGVNPIDNHNLARLTAGSTYPFVLGADFAGVIERVPPQGNDLPRRRPRLRHSPNVRFLCRIYGGQAGREGRGAGPHPRWR